MIAFVYKTLKHKKNAELEDVKLANNLNSGHIFTQNKLVATIKQYSLKIIKHLHSSPRKILVNVTFSKTHHGSGTKNSAKGLQKPSECL